MEDKAERPLPRVSVIIPCYNSSESLASCLEALSSCGAPQMPEVVVVESGDPGYVPELAERFPGVKFVLPGRRLYSGQARNVGVRRSQGQVLLFVDSDCRPEPGWLDSLYRVIDSGIPATSGSLKNATPDSAVGTTQYLLSHSAYSPTMPPRRIDDGAACSGNFAIRREVFDSSGGFAGTYRAVDLQLTNRLREQGVQIGFTPEAAVLVGNETDARALLSEQVKRGYFAAVARIRSGNRGAAAGRFPALAFGLYPVRLLRLVQRQMKYRVVPGGMFLKALPLCVWGLAAWTWGFFKGARDASALPEEAAREPVPADWKEFQVVQVQPPA